MAPSSASRSAKKATSFEGFIKCSKTSKAEIYPVMLTPFTDGNEVDTPSLKRLIDWYEDGGATVGDTFAAPGSSAESQVGDAELRTVFVEKMQTFA